MEKLWKELIKACNAVEEDIRTNEKKLEMQLQVQDAFIKGIKKVIYRTDLNDTTKVNTIKSLLS